MSVALLGCCCFVLSGQSWDTHTRTCTCTRAHTHTSSFFQGCTDEISWSLSQQFLPYLQLHCPTKKKLAPSVRHSFSDVSSPNTWIKLLKVSRL